MHKSAFSSRDVQASYFLWHRPVNTRQSVGTLRGYDCTTAEERDCSVAFVHVIRWTRKDSAAIPILDGQVFLFQDRNMHHSLERKRNTRLTDEVVELVTASGYALPCAFEFQASM